MLLDETLQNRCASDSAVVSSEGHPLEMQSTISVVKRLLRYHYEPRSCIQTIDVPNTIAVYIDYTGTVRCRAAQSQTVRHLTDDQFLLVYNRRRILPQAEYPVRDGKAALLV